MLHDRMTRREALVAGAAAMLPLAAASAASAAGNPQPQPGLTVGIATFGFTDYTNRRLAEELAAQGLRTVQLFLSQTDSRYWKYNGRSDLSDLSAARCREIADTYRSAGIAIHSLGVYTNLIHPDEAERKANLGNMGKYGDATPISLVPAAPGPFADGPLCEGPGTGH